MTIILLQVAGLTLIGFLFAFAHEASRDYVPGLYCSDRCYGDHTNGCPRDPKPTWRRRLVWKVDAVVDRYLDAREQR